MNKVLPATLALLALVGAALPAGADERTPRPASPRPANPGTTERPGSGGDLKGTTTRGTTMRGTTTAGMTMRGTTLGGTTTRAGSGVAAKMTVGTSAPGTPDAARPGAAAIAAGHGTSRFWNEGYYGAGGVARKLSRVVDPSPVLLASDEPVPAATGTGTVRVVDRGFAPGREPAPVDATPTAYREPVRAAPLVVQPSVVASRGAYGPGTFVFRGAGTASGSGSFGGIGTYSGYETWGPVPRFGVAAGCDCR